MPNSSDKSQDSRVYGMEDSQMMTIEYLRARLLAERSVSRAAKERADELAKRVSELEEQLKVVTLQRKTAEKATLDVLSFLASRGISDISEVYESDSDQEESLCESNVGEHDITKGEENFDSSRLKGNNESSGSDHDSTPSSSRSLSWKGRKETTQHFDVKSFDSLIKRRTSLAAACPSSRHRTGKSCRQVKRRELRSVLEECRNDSSKSDGHDICDVNSSDNYTNCLDRWDEEVEKITEKQNQNSFRKKDPYSSLAYVRKFGVSGSHRNECSGDMERALEHQAQLIGCYKAQEKAQRDWEEKNGENNTSTPDSCEPGNHSDVTEERDDRNHGIETQFEDKQPPITQFNSVKINQHTDTGCLQNYDYSEMKVSTSISTSPEFTLRNNKQTQEHGASPFSQSFRVTYPNLQPRAAPDVSLFAGSRVSESKPAKNPNLQTALVPQEELNRLGAVLGALEDAQSLINRQMSSLPEMYGSVGKALGMTPAVQDDDLFRVPVGCPGLFRVPTDHQSQANQIRLLGSDYSPDVNYVHCYSGASALQGEHYTSGSLNPRFNLPSGDPFTSMPIISDRQSRLDFQFTTSHASSSKPSFPSYSSIPNLYPRVSSNQMSFGLAMNDAQKPSPGNPVYYDHGVRSNMYR